MVSLLSFFTGKKKSRRLPSSPTNPSSTSSSNAAQTSSTGRTSPRPKQPRFLSLRHRKSSKERPVTITARRASTEAARKRSPKAKSPTSELPRLALGWEKDVDGDLPRDSLGLEGVGRPPRLNEAEREVLDKHGYGFDGVMQGWKWFGKALRDTGLDTPGVLLGEAEEDKENQGLLLALFTLVISPNLANCFPSLELYYASQAQSSTTSAEWSDRLTLIIKDTTCPTDFAQVLKYLLRRLDPSSSTLTTQARLSLDLNLYRSFARSEKEAGYPTDAYEKIFAPRIDTKQMTYLEEIFEVWAALAAHSDGNGMTGGQITRYLGWWVWGSSVKQDSRWEALYDEWAEAGRRIDHLFHAWIRTQSTKQNLPTRLLQLVEGYPFVATTDEDDSLPSPPSPSIKRRVLRVALASSSRLPDYSSLSASFLVDTALAAKIPSDVQLSLWPSAKSQIHPQRKDGSLELEESPPAQNTSTPVAGPSTATPTTEPMYRPFSTISPDDSRPSHLRRRSQSYSGAKSLLLGPPLQVSSDAGTSSDLLGTSPGRLAKQSSASMLRSSSGQAEPWETFIQSGFADSPGTKLELSPQISTLSPRPMVRGVSFGSDATATPSDSRSRSPLPQKRTDFEVASEEIVEIDDLFFAFDRDGHQDASTSTSWPPFALIRMKEGIAHEDGEIGGVLITAYHRALPVEEPSPAIPRAASPAESTAAKTLNMFRRSSSFGMGNGPRMSLFGRSKSGPRTSASATALPVLSESGSTSRAIDTPPLSAAPTDYTITEMGEMVKIPTASSDAPAPERGISTETLPSDWRYQAEGRAHLIFKYTGSSPAFLHRVLRVRKPTSPVDETDQVGTHWRENLLPRLVLPELLLTAQTVDLRMDWTEKLLEAADEVRPDSRKKETGSLIDALSGKVWAALMDDTTATGSGAIEKIFTVEIKPKWGFLPRAESIHPPEAVPIKSQNSRYVLHRHFRRENIDDTYDPLDLFSGDERRIKNALDGLWGIWEFSEGAKNNWRVYVDGKSVGLNEIDRIPTSSESGSLSDKTAAFLLPALTTGSVLSKLKELQSTFDPIDISSLALQYQQAHPDSTIFEPSTIAEPTQKELESFVDKYLSDPTAGQFTSGWTLREYILAYAISAIFKDCSIFITIPLTKNDGQWTVTSGGKAKIIDLDLKSVKSMRKWYDLDEAIWRHWYETQPSDIAEELQMDQSGLRVSPSGLSTTTGTSTRGMFSPSENGQTTPSRSTVDSELSGPTHDTTGVPDPATTPQPTRAVNVDSVALTDALAMTPSKPAFDHSTLTTNSAAYSLSSDAPALLSLDIDDDVEGEGVGLPSITEESPTVERKKRSTAPSPSPIANNTAPLPEEAGPTSETSDAAQGGIIAAASAATLGALVSGATAIGLLQSDNEDASPAKRHDREGPAAASTPEQQIAEATEAPVDSGAVLRSDESSGAHVPGDPLVPQAIEMLKGDSNGRSEENNASGASTPFESFSTPMTELPEATLLQHSTEQPLPETPALEDLLKPTMHHDDTTAPSHLGGPPQAESTHVAESPADQALLSRADAVGDELAQNQPGDHTFGMNSSAEPHLLHAPAQIVDDNYDQAALLDVQDGLLAATSISDATARELNSDLVVNEAEEHRERNEHVDGDIGTAADDSIVMPHDIDPNNTSVPGDSSLEATSNPDSTVAATPEPDETGPENDTPGSANDEAVVEIIDSSAFAKALVASSPTTNTFGKEGVDIFPNDPTTLQGSGGTNVNTIDPYASNDLPTVDTAKILEDTDSHVVESGNLEARSLESLLTPHVDPLYEPEALEGSKPQVETDITEAISLSSQPLEPPATLPHPSLEHENDMSESLVEPFVPVSEVHAIENGLYPGDQDTEGSFVADTGRLPVVQQGSTMAEFVPHSLPPVLERGESNLRGLDTPEAEVNANPAVSRDPMESSAISLPLASTGVSGKDVPRGPSEELSDSKTKDTTRSFVVEDESSSTSPATHSGAGNATK